MCANYGNTFEIYAFCMGISEKWFNFIYKITNGVDSNYKISIAATRMWANNERKPMLLMLSPLSFWHGLAAV